MNRSRARSTGKRLRRHGLWISAGSWALYADTPQVLPGSLIVALGRTAGSAVTRSRIRRIARDIFKFKPVEAGGSMLLDVLLVARGEVGSRPRRQVRAELSGLMTRALGAMARREAGRVRNA